VNRITGTDGVATGAGSPGGGRPLERRGGKGLAAGDNIFLGVLVIIGALILVVAGAYLVVLYQRGELALSTFGLGFLVSSDWNPVRGEFGALPFLVGTLLTSLGALILAVPLALASALFVTEYAPRWLAGPVSYLVELLAAIPSVVYGMWGIFVLVPFVRQIHLALLTTPGIGELAFIRTPPSGLGLFTAILILTVMIIPFTASVARDVITLVPAEQREAAYALGATKWEVLRTAVLPYARAGIMGGVILSLGRALGETMAVTMVIGNRTDLPDGLFAPTATMASIIANEFAEAVGNLHVSSLMLIGLVLFLLSIVINLLARWLIRRLAPRSVA